MGGHSRHATATALVVVSITILAGCDAPEPHVQSPQRGSDRPSLSLSVSTPTRTNAGRPDGPGASVAALDAVSTCSFDWRETLADRIFAATRYASPRLAIQRRSAASRSAERWQLVQRDHESGRCVVLRSFTTHDAPNTSTVRYERIELKQTVVSLTTAPSSNALTESVVVRKIDGRWFVDRDTAGGG